MQTIMHLSNVAAVLAMTGPAYAVPCDSVPVVNGTVEFAGVAGTFSTGQAVATAMGTNDLFDSWVCLGLQRTLTCRSLVGMNVNTFVPSNGTALNQ